MCVFSHQVCEMLISQLKISLGCMLHNITTCVCVRARHGSAAVCLVPHLHSIKVIIIVYYSCLLPVWVCLTVCLLCCAARVVGTWICLHTHIVGKGVGLI